MKASPTSAPIFDYAAFFESLPLACMAYEVKPPYRIFAENQAHSEVAMVKKGEVIGKGFLEAFPDTSEEFTRTGHNPVIDSLKKVSQTGQPDEMPNIRYDIKDQYGNYVTKYWSATHYPLYDSGGKVWAVYQLTEDITDSLRTQQVLDTTRYQLDQALANGSIGIWSWDIVNQVVTADKNLAKIFGIDVAQAEAGLPLERFTQSIHVADRERVMKDIAQAIETKKPFEQEYRTMTADDDVRWVIARGRVEVDDNGQPVRFPGVAVDITDRKGAESAIAENENRLRFMADSMPQLVWIARPDGYNEYYNQRWYEYTGVENSPANNAGWDNLVHSADLARTKKAWRHSLKTGEPYEIEYRLYHAPSNSYRWVIDRGLAFKDADGTIVKWYGTCTDIDQQKRSAQLQAFLAEASKQLTSSLNLKHNLQKVGQLCIPNIADWCSVDIYNETQDAYEQIFVAHADPKKVTLAKEHRQHNPITTDGKTGVSKVIRTGKAEFYSHITPQMLEQSIKDPETLKFMKQLNIQSIIIVPISINSSPAGALTLVSSDSGRHYNQQDVEMAEELAHRISFAITNSKLYDESIKELNHRKQLEKELLLEKQKLESRVKERTEQLHLTNEGLREEIVKRQQVETELQVYSANLAHSNQELQDFAYVASHDLQEPLRKIQAFGNLLESEYGNELGEGGDYLRRMRAAASRMSTLIEDLLSFSRVTTKAKPGIKVSLDAIVDEVVSDLESRIKETNGRVKADPLPIIKADPTHMRQLFQNLIANALKFHRVDEPPVVTIRAQVTEDGYHEITVSDNGIGFDEKYVDRIFAVFQRLHERDAYEGTGIGLAVCRKIVERYGGTITAKSTKHKGATFIIRLPKKGKIS